MNLYVFVCECLSRSLSLPFSPYLSSFLFSCLVVSVYIYLSIYLSIYLTFLAVYPSIHAPTHPTIHPSIHASVHVSPSSSSDHDRSPTKSAQAAPLPIHASFNCFILESPSREKQSCGQRGASNYVAYQPGLPYKPIVHVVQHMSALVSQKSVKRQGLCMAKESSILGPRELQRLG